MIIRKAHLSVIIALIFCTTESFFGVVFGSTSDTGVEALGHAPSITHVGPNHQDVTPVRIELNDKLTWEIVRDLFSDHQLSFKLDNDEGLGMHQSR